MNISVDFQQNDFNHNREVELYVQKNGTFFIVHFVNSTTFKSFHVLLVLKIVSLDVFGKIFKFPFCFKNITCSSIDLVHHQIEAKVFHIIGF